MQDWTTCLPHNQILVQFLAPHSLCDWYEKHNREAQGRLIQRLNMERMDLVWPVGLQKLLFHVVKLYSLALD
jgi:hypothetical protein